jgi:hypothetical protein
MDIPRGLNQICNRSATGAQRPQPQEAKADAISAAIIEVEHNIRRALARCSTERRTTPSPGASIHGGGVREHRKGLAGCCAGGNRVAWDVKGVSLTFLSQGAAQVVQTYVLPADAEPAR